MKFERETTTPLLSCCIREGEVEKDCFPAILYSSFREVSQTMGDFTAAASAKLCCTQFIPTADYKMHHEMKEEEEEINFQEVNEVNNECLMKLFAGEERKEGRD
jgi:uncharacterized protein (UPF0218 family)